MLRPFGRSEIVRLVLHREQHHVLVNVRVVAEDFATVPSPAAPMRRDRLTTGGATVPMCVCGALLAEVGRSVFFLGAHLGFGLDAKIVVERVAVAGVGGQPERTRESLAVVAERKLQAVDGRAAMRAVGVVELGIANAHLHVGHALAARGAVGQRAVLRANRDEAGVADRVAEEVGRQLLVVARSAAGLPSDGEGAMQLGGHGVEEHGRGLLRAGGSRMELAQNESCRGDAEQERISGSRRSTEGFVWRGTSEIRVKASVCSDCRRVG